MTAGLDASALCDQVEAGYREALTAMTENRGGPLPVPIPISQLSIGVRTWTALVPLQVTCGLCTSSGEWRNYHGNHPVMLAGGSPSMVVVVSPYHCTLPAGDAGVPGSVA